MAEAAPKGFGLALSVAVIAVFLAVGAIAFAYVGASTQVNNLSSQVSTLQTQIPGLIAKSGLASVNATPATMAFRVDWCNTDNTGQDRFCPPVLVVHQGDLVQILFETNTSTGMHDFLTDTYFQSSCIQASYSQGSSGLSSSDCVSGSSLLAPGGTFKVPINPNPASSPLPPATPELITVDNMFHFVQENATYDATWSIASFRATIPGIFEYYCYYHVSNGMFGYLIVLPNTYCNTHTAACTSTSNSNPT
jgi:hypothetical protein